MKLNRIFCLVFVLGVSGNISADEFDPSKFAESYFAAWTATQSPSATSDDVENYLSFLADDVGHQHLPYDPDDERLPDGKESMREGMGYYLGAHTEYTGTLLSHMGGYDVVIIKYDTHSKGVHPQTQEVIEQKYTTVEVLEIEDGKVAVIRKYSE